MANKATKAEIEIRLREIANMLIKGKNTTQIANYSSEKWEISRKQTLTYIRRAEKVITQSVEKNVERDYSMAIQRYKDLYQKAYENNDLRLCRMIVKDLTELQELSKQRIEHTGNIQFISNIPIEKND